MIHRAFLSETTFLPYFMTAWCVFFYQSVCFLPMVFVTFPSEHYVSMFLYDSVGKKINTLPSYDLIFDFPLPNAISVTLAFMWYFNYTIKAH